MMAEMVVTLEEGKYYHIYNRGINSCVLFEHEEDFRRFLSLVEKYILPVADIYAWVIMPNHFHFLIRIRENMRYKYSMEEIKKASADNLNKSGGANANRSDDAVGLTIVSP